MFNRLGRFAKLKQTLAGTIVCFTGQRALRVLDNCVELGQSRLCVPLGSLAATHPDTNFVGQFGRRLLVHSLAEQFQGGVDFRSFRKQFCQLKARVNRQRQVWEGLDQFPVMSPRLLLGRLNGNRRQCDFGWRSHGGGLPLQIFPDCLILLLLEQLLLHPGSDGDDFGFGQSPVSPGGLIKHACADLGAWLFLLEFSTFGLQVLDRFTNDAQSLIQGAPGRRQLLGLLRRRLRLARSLKFCHPFFPLALTRA